MERWVGKVAVITGASAGIGFETAKSLVQNGMIVVELARRKEKMENELSKLAGAGKFYAKKCDITKEKDVIEAFEWIAKNLKTVNILVNNAGCIKAGSIADLKTEDLQRIIDVNVMGLLHCTRQAIKLMKANKEDAHIININSNAGHRVPLITQFNINIYPATKFAVTALSETLIQELNGTKIRATSISPGVVKTEIFEVGEIDASVIKNAPSLNPEDVTIVYVISAPHHVQITELTIKPLGQIH